MTYAGMYIGDEISIGGVVFNQVDEYGCKWILEDLDGWWGLPEPNVPNDSRAFSEDGNYFAPGRYEARQITMSGIIVPPNGVNGPVAAALARNALNRRLNLVRTVATLRVAEASSFPNDELSPVPRTPKIASVQLVGRPLTRFDDLTNVLKFNFQLRAADPRKYIETLEYGETQLLAISGGRQYDKVFSYIYGGTGSDGAMTIINQGSYDSFGVLRIVGPVVSPTIEHVELGKTLSLNMTLSTNEYLDINLRDHTVLFNSTASRRAALMPKSEWFWLIPGTNTLRYTGSQVIPARPELEAAMNLATNPSFETQFGVDSTRTNRAKRPRPYSAGTDTGWTATAGTSETGATVIGGLDPAATGVLIRKNYAFNPRPASTLDRWSWQTGAGEVGTSSIGTSLVVEDAPLPGVVTYARRSISTEKTSGTSGWFYRAVPGDISGTTGDAVTVSMYVRVSADITISPSINLRSGAASVSTLSLGSVSLVADTWTRLSGTITATASYDGFQIWASIPGTSFFSSAATVDASAVLAEKTSVLGAFFDGSFGDVNDTYDQQYTHMWTGTMEASVSDETLGVVPGAMGNTGMIGFKRRIISTPKTAGVSGITYTSDTSDISLTTGGTITLSAYVRSSHAVTVNPVGQALLGITSVTSATGSAVTLTPGLWSRISVTLTVTGSVNTFSLSANLAASQIIPSRGFFDMTSMLAEYGTTLLPYFDGSFKESDSDGQAAWSSTVGQSASVLSLFDVRELGGASAAMTGGGGGSSAVYQSNLWSITGTSSIAVNANGAATNSTHALPAGTIGGITKMNMVPGAPYTVSCYIYLDAPQNVTGISSLARTISIDVTTPAGTTTAFAVSSQAPNVVGVYRLSMSFTLPSDATNAVLKLTNGAMSGIVRFDALMIEPGSTLSTTYVDGDSPYATWGGTAHNSISSRPYIEGVPNSVIQLSYRSAWIE